MGEPIDSGLKYASDTDYTNTLLGFTGACLILSSLAITARCSVRISRKTDFGLDDLFALAGFVGLVTVLIGNFLVATSGAVGLDPMMTLYEKQSKNALTCNLVGFTLTMCCGKLSLLFLYRRIFGMRETWFRFAWWGVFLFLFPVFTTISFIFAGFQIAHDNMVEPSTFDTLGVIIVSTVCACTNLCVLILPVGSIINLQLARPKKIGVIFIFSLGSLGAITAFLRSGRSIQYLQEHWDPRYRQFESVMMDAAEATALILCASLPLIRPVFVKVKQFTRWSFSASTRSSRKTTDASGVSGRKLKLASEDTLELKHGVIHCQTEYEVSSASDIDA